MHFYIKNWAQLFTVDDKSVLGKSGHEKLKQIVLLDLPILYAIISIRNQDIMGKMTGRDSLAELEEWMNWLGISIFYFSFTFLPKIHDSYS